MFLVVTMVGEMLHMVFYSSPSGSVFLFCVVSMVLEAMYPPPNVRMKVCVRARIFGGMSVFWMV